MTLEHIRTGLEESTPRRSEFRSTVRVLLGRKIVLLGLIIILMLIATAILAPIIAPYKPDEMHLEQSLLQPSKDHLLGTDPIGRDILSRLIYGTRIAFLVGIGASGIASIIGMFLGLIAGYLGNITHMVIMRFTDALMSFPPLLTAVVLAAMLGPGLSNVMIALSVSLMPVYIRLMCGQVLTVKENDYVTAGKVIGTSNVRIMLRSVLPNCLSPIIVAATLQIGLAILSEASLSFLGFGVEPQTAAWGSMVADGYGYLLERPILSIAPGLCVMIMVISFNIVGDGLRDALDPRLRGIL